MRAAAALLVIAIGAGIAGAGWNDGFYTDPNCVSVYRLESGALIVDSKATNTLTASGGPTADTVHFQEGAASADLERTSSQRLSRTDADLTANFPGKSGGSQHSFTFTCWVQPESGGSDRAPMAKRGVAAFLQESSGTDLLLCLDATHAWSGPVMVVEQWYFLGGGWDAATRTMRYYVWDATAGAVVTSLEETIGAGQGPIKTSTNSFNISGDGGIYGGIWTDPFDGNVDEATVWNRLLTLPEIDKIRQGIYTMGGAKIMRLVEN